VIVFGGQQDRMKAADFDRGLTAWCWGSYGQGMLIGYTLPGSASYLPTIQK